MSEAEQMREHIRIIVFHRLQGRPASGMRGPYMKHARPGLAMAGIQYDKFAYQILK